MSRNSSQRFGIGGVSVHDAGALGSPRLEARWIVSGSVPPSTVDWFAQLPSRYEQRDDLYLVTPKLADLAVKIRGGVALDVKEFHGQRGVLDLSGIGRGRLESWQKWSFSLGPEGASREEPHGWRRVTKRRRLTSYLPDEDELVPAFQVPAELLACSIEFSEVAVDDASWWTVAFESTGPEERLEEAIEATANRLTEADPPADLRLDLSCSGPYSEWLTKLERRHRTDRLWQQARR
jgi:hypothetical protein